MVDSDAVASELVYSFISKKVQQNEKKNYYNGHNGRTKEK